MLADRAGLAGKACPQQKLCFAVPQQSQGLFAQAKHRARLLQCKAGGSSKSQRRKAKRPGLFEVQVITPPKESLGIHALPPDTHNGDQIQVEGKDFVVSSLIFQYKLVCGRYQRDHNRLDVQETSRFFLNLHLESLLEKSAKSA